MNSRLAAIALSLALLPPFAHAERADREKPMLLEANKISIDDARKVQILEGDVVITKGTIIIKANRIIITEDKYGFQKGVAFGSKNALAYMRQKREGRDDYVEGQAERIEYDTNSEVAELFHRAWVKSGEDEVRGDYIWYDAISEKYLVSAGDAKGANAPAPRVRAVIQPRNKDSEPARPAGRGERLNLKGAGSLGGNNAQD